jgi:hypothetical protein
MEAATAPAIMVEWISFYLFLILIGGAGFCCCFLHLRDVEVAQTTLEL